MSTLKMRIKLSVETMRNILDEEPDDCGDLVGGVVEDRIIDTSRWSTIHELIFTYQGKHYQSTYSCGATEMQDEGPWEYEKEVECTEVQQVEKIVKVWEVV